MSIFQMPGYPSIDAARLEKMSKDLTISLPQDVAAAINLMAHPAAGAMAMSALGLGLASHAFGIWAGLVAGAAETSQRLLAPLAFADQGAGAATSAKTPKRTAAEPIPFTRRPKPALKVVPKAEPVEAERVEAEPVKAEPGKAQSMKADPVETRPVGGGSGAPKAQVVPSPLKAEASPRPAKPVEPAAAVAETEVGPVVAPPKPVSRQTASKPDGLRKPRTIERPAKPDDLKAISGIGPKLEKVLNDLGVWTYAQIAAWGKQEVGWIDDYLSFGGRIDRDGWIEQAKSLSGPKKSKGK
ncbi:NADH-ubiquinone dehydrogenase [Mesorhizobium sp. BAC0120]|uniref:NADH-ubiquinone dehydrogenase n=1 Tax=Mesorhizobium sp. BAC0120 TaxID=3090670 RepID=UPI00298D5537|nr:NADH-ubiquinone dehydrogenase [Mesorhizobium sp. BAC0120]MDW6021469.1 NADH-ubiquinone dehydrogenase [Mesorhizobium sp. BAC0120]